MKYKKRIDCQPWLVVKYYKTGQWGIVKRKEFSAYGNYSVWVNCQARWQARLAAKTLREGTSRFYRYDDGVRVFRPPWNEDPMWFHKVRDEQRRADELQAAREWVEVMNEAKSI